MASLIPVADQRLSESNLQKVCVSNRLTQCKGNVDHNGLETVNFASDFIAQYTTRQEYRYSKLPLARSKQSQPGEFFRRSVITAVN